MCGDGQMVRLILVKELRLQMGRPILLGSAGVLIFLMGLSGGIASAHFRAARAAWQDRAILQQEDMRQTEYTLSRLIVLTYTWELPPRPLFFIASDDDLPRVIRAEGFLGGSLALQETAREYSRIVAPHPFDWTFLIGLLFSFFVIILAHGTIAEEKERGTLSLVLSYPISRVQLLVGKLLAHGIIISVVFLASVLASLIVIILLKSIPLNQWGRIGMSIGIGLLYLHLFLLISLIVSCLTHRAVTSLLLLISLWVFWGIFIPQAATIVVERLIPYPSEEEWVERQRPSLGPDALRYALSQLRGQEADRAALARWMARWYEAYVSDQNRWLRERVNAMVRQVEAVRRITHASPIMTFQMAQREICGTSHHRSLAFIMQVLSHRMELYEALRYAASRSAGSMEEMIFPYELGSAKARPEDLPAFHFVEPPLAVTSALAIPVGLLLAEFLIGTIVLFSVFARYDVR